ncbi:MAG TPA: hypothetical protein VHE35_12195 [Kofleriaceae bacterium]|nr:hypothetical protein [Kofleriaceae bacterium]
MMILIGLLLIVASILAVSGFIISKKPEAKQLIDKIVPFQGFIGVALLALGVIFLIGWIGKTDDIGAIGDHWTLFPFAFYLGTASAIVLGFLFGMPLIAKWIPGETPAEVKAMEMQKKLAAFQTIIGIVGLVFGLLMLYYRFKSEHGFNMVKALFGAYGKMR